MSTAIGIVADNTKVDAVVVGAGFGGLYMLHRLLKLGLSVRVFEKGSGVGGTWYWNRYPGARCDVESLEYSYSFSDELQQEWEWTERYAGQPEILGYLEHVAKRFSLMPHICFNTGVESMRFDEDTQSWTIRTTSGSVQARFCVLATGCLSVPNVPDIPGLESFSGRLLHTGNWPADGIDLTGKRVGIIGSGSSAVQSLPEIAAHAGHVYLFQRTPNFSVPAGNVPLADSVQQEMKAHYREFRRQQRATPFAAGPLARSQSALDASPQERQHHYDQRWKKGGLTFVGAFSDLLVNPEANRTAADYVASRIREKVRNPVVAEKLIPDHPIGCKRLCADSGYYECFNQENVSLVDLRDEPLSSVSETGVHTQKSDYPLDVLILATGFDAMTGAITRIDISGRAGVHLAEKWAHGAAANLGILTAGFPNLFLMTGPGSPSVLANMVTGLEQHAEWISDCIRFLLNNGHRQIEAQEQAQSDWMQQVGIEASGTLFVACNSWYVGANIPGKPKVFLPYIGGFDRYESICNDISRRGYPGFTIS